MRPLRIDPINQVLISNSDANTLTRNEIQTDDVLITRTGAIVESVQSMIAMNERLLLPTHLSSARNNLIHSFLLFS